MTDQDIIDTIAVALAGEANADLAGLDAAAVLAALRDAGYVVVQREDIRTGLARGDKFRTVAAAGARMRLRETVGLIAAEADQ